MLTYKTDQLRNLAANEMKNAPTSTSFTVLFSSLYFGLIGVRNYFPALLPPVDAVRDIAPLAIALHLFLALIVCFGVFWNGAGFASILGHRWNEWQHSWREILLGVFLGLSAVGLAILCGLFFDSTPRSSGPTARNIFELSLEILVAGSAGLSEEIIFRGYFLRQVQFWSNSSTLAVLVQAILFYAAHGIRQQALDISIELSIAVLFGLISLKRQSLLPVITAHMVLNSVGFVITYHAAGGG